MTARRAIDALDYPRIADDLFVAWVSNGKPWPAANRDVRYLTSQKTHITKGFALFGDWDTAETFTSLEEAARWVEENEAKRPHPYGVNITTVAELKARCGYL